MLTTLSSWIIFTWNSCISCINKAWFYKISYSPKLFSPICKHFLLGIIRQIRDILQLWLDDGTETALYTCRPVTFPMTSAQFSASPHQWKQGLYSSTLYFQQIGRFTVSSLIGKGVGSGKDLGPPIPESISDTKQRYFIKKSVWLFPHSDLKKNSSGLHCQISTPLDNSL